MWYGQCGICDAEYVVTVGGDGTTLKALHAVLPFAEKPVFSMRLGGSIGFLGNRFDLANLRDRLKSARKIFIRPLKAEVQDVSGRGTTIFGINEIVLTRQRLGAAKLSVTLTYAKIPLRRCGRPEKKRIADPAKRCNDHRRIVAVGCPELAEIVQ